MQQNLTEQQVKDAVEQNPELTGAEKQKVLGEHDHNFIGQQSASGHHSEYHGSTVPSPIPVQR